MSAKHQLEVCFSPALYQRYHSDEAIVAVVDILRATSAIATAFSNGVNRIIPVETLDEARHYKEQGYLIAAERDGIMPDFADLGNNPCDFRRAHLDGHTIVYSTTNGTQSIQMASAAHAVVIASYVNHSAVSSWLLEQGRDILILCAGWKDRFSLEDAVYAGALAESILASGAYETMCDSAIATIDLWREASKDLHAYKEKYAHMHRLRKLGLDDCIDYCLSFDGTDAVPVFMDGSITNVKNEPAL